MRGDYQAALIAKVIADVNTRKGRRNKIENFFYKWGVKSRGVVEQDESLVDPG